MVILQQVLNFESVALDYFCSNMVFNPCWLSGNSLWLENVYFCDVISSLINIISYRFSEHMPIVILIFLKHRKII